MKRTDQSLFAQAFGYADLQNVRDAAAILNFGKKQEATFTETLAAAIRFGYMQGKRENRKKITELYQRIHEQESGSAESVYNDADRCLEFYHMLVLWLENPEELQKLADRFYNRASILIRNQVSDEVIAEAEARESIPAAADQRGDTDNDVDSNGKEEVEHNV